MASSQLNIRNSPNQKLSDIIIMLGSKICLYTFLHSLKPYTFINASRISSKVTLMCFVRRGCLPNASVSRQTHHPLLWFLLRLIHIVNKEETQKVKMQPELFRKTSKLIAKISLQNQRLNNNTNGPFVETLSF